MAEPHALTTHPELVSHQSFPVFRSLDTQPKSRLERSLSIFADLRAGEGITAVMMTASIFLLLAAYYLLKPVREALILSESGAEVKSYSAAAQALLLLAIVPFYGWFASKVNRRRLLASLTGFFSMNLVLFWFLGSRGMREGVVFYIWLGIFNVFMVSQFWAFANDIYTEGQGKRLFPFIGVGMSVGALAGSTLVAPLVKGSSVSPYSLMLIAAAVLLGCLALMLVVNARQARTATPEAAGKGEEPLGAEGGFQLILQDRYLFWIAVLIVLLNVVNTIGEYALGKLVVVEAAKAGGNAKVFISQFYGHFYSMVNLLGLLLQTLGASRVFRYCGVRGALFILPVLALLSYCVLAVAPILVVVRWAKILENSTDYSIMNTVRQALWLPTSREAKYKAKAAVDTFFMRAGDVLQAGIVFLGTMVGAGITEFAWLNVALTVAWLLAAGRIAAEHRKKTAKGSAMPDDRGTQPPARAALWRAPATHNRIVGCLLVCVFLSGVGPLDAEQPPYRVREGGVSAAAATSSSVKVLSWNIERGLRLPDVVDTLQRHGASLVLLQEVDLNSRRTGRRNIAEELARSLRMQYLFAAEFEELGQGNGESPAFHGQAILASMAVSSPRIIRFENQTGFWRPRSYLPNWRMFQRRTGGRLALVAEVDVAGRPLVVYNAHLESRGSEQLRKAQIEEIVADSRRYPVDAPILIAGDFNTRTTPGPVIAALLQAGFHMALGQQVTTTRGSALDWIFVRGPLTFEKGVIHSDAKASDHFPLTVVIHFDHPASARRIAIEPLRRTL